MLGSKRCYFLVIFTGKFPMFTVFSTFFVFYHSINDMLNCYVIKSLITVAEFYIFFFFFILGATRNIMRGFIMMFFVLFFFSVIIFSSRRSSPILSYDTSKDA